VEESFELSGDSHVEESSELSADSHVDDRVEPPAADAELRASDPELGAATEGPAAGHGFIDPDELAGRVVSGESDVHAASDEPEGRHAHETDSAEDPDGQHAADPEEQSASESDGADASAHDDPAVD
jgi:hypothetical protein